MSAPAAGATSPSRLGVLRNLAGALPAIAWFGLGASSSYDHLRLMPDFARQTFAARVQTASDIFTLALFVTLIALLLVRRTAVASSPGLSPKMAAAAAFAFPFVLLAMPQSEAGDTARLAASLCSLIGAIVALAALACLGRSFSIFPQARGLVTGGPYALVRHPVYAAELVIFLGASLERVGAWTWLLAPLAVAIQVPRMRYEEALLAVVFPDYEAFARRTPWRLVPGVY